MGARKNSLEPVFTKRASITNDSYSAPCVKWGISFLVYAFSLPYLFFFLFFFSFPHFIYLNKNIETTGMISSKSQMLNRVFWSLGKRRRDNEQNLQHNTKQLGCEKIPTSCIFSDSFPLWHMTEEPSEAITEGVAHFVGIQSLSPAV